MTKEGTTMTILGPQDIVEFVHHAPSNVDDVVTMSDSFGNNYYIHEAVFFDPYLIFQVYCTNENWCGLLTFDLVSKCEEIFQNDERLRVVLPKRYSGKTLAFKVVYDPEGLNDMMEYGD